MGIHNEVGKVTRSPCRQSADIGGVPLVCMDRVCRNVDGGFIIIRDFLITILRTYAEYKDKPIDTSYFAKTKTFAQLVVIYLFLVRYIVYTDPALYKMMGWFFDEFGSVELMNVMMVIVTIMTAATGIYYFVVNWNILKELITPGAYGTNNE